MDTSSCVHPLTAAPYLRLGPADKKVCNDSSFPVRHGLPPSVSTPFAAKTPPLPIVSTAFVAKTRPSPSVSTAFAATSKTPPLPCAPQVDYSNDECQGLRQVLEDGAGKRITDLAGCARACCEDSS